MAQKLEIAKNTRKKGDDGYRVFSIRIKESTITALDVLSKQSERSRNELINILLEYAIKNSEIIER